MRSTWPTARLGDVVRYRKEFVTIGDLTVYQRPRVQLHAQGIIRRDEVPGALINTKRQQVCRTGQFLVAEIDAKLGGFGIVPQTLSGAIVSSHYFLFDLNPASIDTHFLSHVIRTREFRNQVEAQGSTNYAAIRPADVLGYEIPLPSLAEQRRLVARIEAIAVRISEAESVQATTLRATNTLGTVVLRRAIEDCEADNVELADVCEAIIDNLHSNPRYGDSGVPCVRSPDVGWGRLDLDRALLTDEMEYTRRTVRGEPRPGDIVFVREGGGTGKCALVLPGQRFSLGQRVMMLRPNTKRVLPQYMLYHLLAPTVQEDQIAPLSKGSASPHLNIGSLRRFRFRLPTLDEQTRVVTELDRVLSHISALKQLQVETAAELAAMLPAILDRAFNKEL